MADMNGAKPDVGDILFGLNRREDERSLAAFLRIMSEERMAATLIPRLSDAEIAQMVDLFFTLMHKHLSRKEYHTLFLGEVAEKGS